MLNFAGAFKVYCAVAAKTVLKPKEQDKKQAEKKQKANRRKDADSKTGIEKSDQNSKQSEQYDDGSLENVQSDEYDEHGKHDDYDDYDDLEDYEYSPEELEYIKQQRISTVWTSKALPIMCKMSMITPRAFQTDLKIPKATVGAALKQFLTAMKP